MDTTNNKQQTIDLKDAKLALKFGEKPEELKFRNTEFGHRTPKHYNDFTKPIETVKSFLLLSGLDPEEVEFSLKTGRRRVWFGHLKAGRSASLGIKFKLAISEIYQTDTNTISYAIDADIARIQEKEVSEEIKNLFDLPDKPNNVKPRKNSKGKK